ncbi:Glutathione S-transferase, N-terminal:Glutathione S-transferase, C-terminal [Pseudomonas syringae pv. helianthi]|uniref:Glutathione S-transferase, N-terminal:Glutathione S-transferase n=1 Tax=Pseudomonas syringae pv. helianthi TaxID=251654 RepID=A0A0P9SGU4_9PSED|nr:glutathione S-transferase family protein [Pseudomonas syringae group genomosp. 7]KPX41908.1 Glutathione S-transferase, N-terminal:Glutathione S-transferase, C-terminal [Pseudomonas syringae pv. helianthi]RMR05189.1 Glutathione S-transferase, N-terminal:Glutathione S-transferase [Pseudomonas syringae pv. helianthi]RMV50930.1 Glutathione S-transferase, N-terminal:Glutathione S-transferase [Pseudomonas syringae pv. helianthi]UNB61449.1 glutathione S-transferase family protein [Pseudomonas syrin
MYKVYGDYNSGNCYKVKLMLNLLGSEYEWVPVDILNGETQTPAFLEKNPNGKIPVLELEDGTCLWESNAILNFLADGSSYLPGEPRLRTQVLQWQFFEQYSHEPSVAVARFIQFYLGLPAERMAEYRAMQKSGYRALAVMEQQLDRTPFLVGDNFSIADIALYAYTHVAHQGGFDLAPYTGIRRWLDRVKAQPGYVGMLD